MLLYIYVDGTDLEDIAGDVSSAIESWVKESALDLTFVDNRQAEPEASEDVDLDDPSDWRIGVNLSIRNKKQLKEPLEGLYKIAKRLKCEFVIGIIDEKTGEQEDVCYFGFEEGQPDMFEVGNYLGI
ncbi:conserved hypothetical protein [Hahella chejuensis KCTC 2396]|uniref:Uncharacterized protein n=1 Tax=Hahella chejuensis (strain KCTC 2396) TaxID=349521 RepID=Q2SEU9_HAHCH|nr:hypothetical protein [Hahella chejuensis]ABC30825.1 conserved hypothetical protein [Hahella chejuensis KCTC 2396]